MVEIIGIVACTSVFLLGLLIFKVKRVVRNLMGAVQAKRHLLQNQPSLWTRWMGLEGLLVQVNDLVDRHNEYAAAQSGRLKQLEATLGSIQEAVIIFSDERIVEYANESARQLFRQGEELKGLCLEPVLRSPDLIECLSVCATDQSGNLKQVSLERQGNLRWFEVSCGEVHEVSKTDNVSTLLVLHDIT